MELSSTTSGDHTVVSVAGRLDTTTAPELERFCTSQVQSGSNRLILDFQKLEYISSSGLRAVLASAKMASASGGKFAVCGLTGPVLEVFRISSFDSILPVFADADAAVKGGA